MFTYTGPVGESLQLQLSNSLALLLGFNLNLPLTLPAEQCAQVSVLWLADLKLDLNHPNHRLIFHFDENKSSIRGNQAPQLYFLSQFIHVYYNLSESTFFNGKLTNSLRVVPLIQKKVDKYVCHIVPKQLQFFEVKSKTIDHVDIELRDNQNTTL